jgi:putative FmdB family regulatory protein
MPAKSPRKASGRQESFTTRFNQGGAWMPTYQYACIACGHEFEVVQSFSDESLTKCPECQGEIRKIYSAVGVVFKGSGFYKTDSAKKSVTSDPPKASPTSPAPKAD